MAKYVNTNTNDVVTLPEPSPRLERLKNWIRLDPESEPPPVMRHPEPAVDDVPAPEFDERDALFAEAERLGVKVDRRWGVRKIQIAIDTAGR